MKLIYDKNGCGSPDIYCWKCSGKEDDHIGYLRSGEERIPKGRMKPQTQLNESVHYQCLDCNYETHYRSDYIKEWKI